MDDGHKLRCSVGLPCKNLLHSLRMIDAGIANDVIWKMFWNFEILKKIIIILARWLSENNDNLSTVPKEDGSSLAEEEPHEVENIRVLRRADPYASLFSFSSCASSWFKIHVCISMEHDAFEI